MKISFSTIGCPGLNLNEISSIAKDLGYDGIEIRGLGHELYAPKCAEFSSANISISKKRLNGLNLEIPVIDTAAALGYNSELTGCDCPCDFTGEYAENAVSEAKDYIDLAAELGAPYIRVMCSSKPEPEKIDLEQCADLLLQIAEYGEKQGVMPLIETNGVLADSAVMRSFMEGFNCYNIGVLWDIHHPYRFFNEEPALTVQNIGKYIRHVHIKDSVVDGGKIVYKMAGHGDVPVDECVAELKKINYDGYLSLEWVKLWQPELEEPGIVFAHYINYVKNI